MTAAVSTLADCQRKSYYSGSSTISGANGSVFMDIFRQASTAAEDPEETASGTNLSVFALTIKPKSGGELAFTIDRSGENADTYFDDADNVYAALKEQYQDWKSSGFTSATVSDAELQQIADIFAKVSSFQHNSDEAFYGEKNAASYTLSTGSTISMTHQEIVAEAGVSLPASWSSSNPLASLPTGGTSDDVEEIPADDDEDVDETDDSGETDDTEEEDSPDDGDGWNAPTEALTRGLFYLIAENQDGIAAESDAENDLRSAVNGLYSEMVYSSNSLAQQKERFDEAMPFIAQNAQLCSDYGTVYNLCLSINSTFDTCFLNDDYSVKSTTDGELSNTLRQMRGEIDQALKTMKKMVNDLDVYSETHPLDPTSTTSDPVWEKMLVDFKAQVKSFFSATGTTTIDTQDFLATYAGEDTVEEEEEETAATGPTTGVPGELFKLINANSSGISLSSAAESSVLTQAANFQSGLITLRNSAASTPVGIKKIFDESLPYLEKAASLLKNQSAAQSVADSVYNAFSSAFLNSDRSIASGTATDLAVQLKTIRTSLDKSYKALAAQTDAMNAYAANSSVSRLATDATWKEMQTKQASLLASFFDAANTPEYADVIAQFAQTES